MMSPRDRVIRALHLEQPDTVPVVLLLTAHASRVFGIKISEMRKSSKLNYMAQVTAIRKYQLDNIFPYMDVAMLWEDLGGAVKIPEDDIPSVTSPIIKSPVDLSLFKLPENGGAAIKESLRSLELLSKDYREDLAVFAGSWGPFTLAGMARGISDFLKELIVNPEFAESVLKISYKVSVSLVKLLIDHGAQVILVSDPLASQISPRHFESYAFPYLQGVVREVKKRGMPTVLHICGDVTLILEKMAKTDADCLWIDQKVDIGYAKRVLSEEVCIMGNIDPVATLLKGKPIDVEDSVRTCIEKAMEGGGFIVSAGCEVPINTPFENVAAMVQAAREFGKLP